MLKKRTFYLLCSLLLLFCVFSDTQAASYVTSGMIEKDWTCGEMRRGGYQQMDGQNVFCIEPGIIYKTGRTYQVMTSRPSYLSLEKSKKIALISYYGSKYYTDERHYAAAQSLIWVELGRSVESSTFKVNGTKVSEEMNDILNLVNSHYTKPSFHQKTITINVGDTYELIDENNVLERFDYTKMDGLDIKKEKNKLLITPTKMFNESVVVKVDHLADSKQGSTLYYKIPGTTEGNGWQICGRFYVEDPIFSEFTIQVTNYQEPIIKQVSQTAKKNHTQPITILKKDIDTKQPLEDVLFDLYVDEKKIASNLKTDENGTITYSYVTSYEAKSDTFSYIENYDKLSSEDQKQYSHYDKSKEAATKKANEQANNRVDALIKEAQFVFEAREVQPREGYKDTATKQSTNGNFEFFNETIKINIEVLKQDASTKNPLPQAIFGLYAKEDIIHPDGKTGVVYSKDEFVLELEPTDENGKSKAEDLLPGDYYLKEIQAPSHYERNEDIIEIEKDCYFVTVENKAKTGAIDLKKYDKETHQTSRGDSCLEGAVYGLYAKEDIYHPDLISGILYEKDKLVEEFPAISSTLTASLENLPFGQYYIQEIKAPLGYQLNSEKIPVLLDDDTPYVLVEAEDEVIKHSLSIHKYTIDKESFVDLENIKFEVKLKSEVDVLGWQQATLYDVLCTDKYGSAISKPLPYGTYLIKEIDSPSYLHPIAPICVDLMVEDVHLEIKNDKVLSGIRLNKINLHNQPLENATFELMDESFSTIDKKTSDKQGIVVFENLPHGIYYLLEVKAPNGYQLNEQYLKIELNEAYDEEHFYELSVVNEEIVVHKTGDTNFIFYACLGLVVSSISIFILKKRTKA